MIKLPDKIKLSPVTFMDGAKGYALQQFENKEFGIRLSRERQDRTKPFEEHWSTTMKPGAYYLSYEALRKDVNKT